MSGKDSVLMKRLLVFIPCHTDYEMALANAEKLLTEIESAVDLNLDVRIVISVNSVESLVRPVIHSRISYKHVVDLVGGDANIANGFVTALEQRPDYFWILSANEDITANALFNLDKLITVRPDASLLIANAAGRMGDVELKNVFTEIPAKMALGLISGVIYNFEATRKSFFQSTLFSWSGWGQLAVIQHHLKESIAKRIYEFPDLMIYNTPYIYTSKNVSDFTERQVVRNLYTHSFYGLPVLGFCLMQNDVRALKEFQSQWLKNNWFKLNSFNDFPNFGDEIKLERIVWIRALCQQSFAKFPILRAVYFVSSKLPVKAFENNRAAIRLLTLYKRIT